MTNLEMIKKDMKEWEEMQPIINFMRRRCPPNDNITCSRPKGQLSCKKCWEAWFNQEADEIAPLEREI